MQRKKLKVLFLCSEAAPYAKTGGLGDVCGALPRELNRLGVDARLVLPFYWSVKRGIVEDIVWSGEITMGHCTLRVNVYESRGAEGLKVYLVDREDMFQRPNLYAGQLGDYYDNFERFVFFCHVSVSLCALPGVSPTILHCNDWQTGLVPALLRSIYSRQQSFPKIKTVFTIHNIGYQGVFPKEKFHLTGLDEKDFFHPEALEYWGKVSLLKAGIVFSDAVTTVSPKYAEEIQSREYGMGMEGILKAHSHKLRGILNGVDEDLWDPSRDKYLCTTFHLGKIEGKAACKKALIEELGLKGVKEEAPILCMVTRLDKQKGLDLLLQIVESLLKEQVNLVILASGDEALERKLENAASLFPKKMVFISGFDEAKAHRIIGGADILLMPSRYEPCGLTQMYALKYGTIPVVRATGGLDDTVQEFDPQTGKGNGFKFSSYDPAAFLKAIKKALSIYSERALWQRIIKNAMKSDFSWRRSAEQYIELYESILAES